MPRALGLDGRSTLGLVTVVGTLTVLVLGFTGALNGLFGGPDTRTVTAVFEDTQQLRAGGQVRIDGVEVGEVEEIVGDPKARRTTVTMKVERDAGPLYSDATAVLRWRTVLGGSFYVDLERGTASSGQLASGSIPVERTARQVELDDVSSVFDERAREGLRSLPPELTKALRDPAEAARALEVVADISPAATQGLGALRGIAKGRDLRALIKNTDATISALDADRDDLGRVVSGAAATLSTTAARGGDIRTTLRTAPGTFRRTESTLVRLESTLDGVDGLLGRLRDPADDVAPTLRALRPTAVEATRLLDRATPLLRALKPAASSLRRAAAKGLPLFTELQPSFDRLDDTILPMLSEKDPQTTKSTAVMIGGTFAGLASGAGGQMDGNGHFIRFPASAGSTPVYSLPCQTYILNPDKESLLACQTLEEALKTYLSYEPLAPTPGTADGKEGPR
jgi:phospholipid/cholesterol/gamma-HCH transport system substrate-binding protein